MLPFYLHETSKATMFRQSGVGYLFGSINFSLVTTGCVIHAGQLLSTLNATLYNCNIGLSWKIFLFYKNVFTNDQTYKSAKGQVKLDSG